MTTIPDIKSTYKTWFTWASLTPAQQAFATSQGYSSGSVSVAIGDIVDYVTQTVASTQTLLVDANGDPVCNYGFNGVANIPTDCSLEVTGGVLGVTPIVVNPPIAIGTSITTGVISGVISSAINSVDYTNQSTCRDVLVRVVSIIYVNRQLSSLGGVNGNMMSTHSTLFDNGSGVLVVDNSVVPQMSSYGPSSIDYNLFKIHPIVVPANSTITLRTQSQVGINSASNYAAIAAETASTIYVITEGYVN